MGKEVLVLDDEQVWLDTIANILALGGYTSILCGTLEEAYIEVDKRIQKGNPPHMFLVDIIQRDPQTKEIINFLFGKKLFRYIKTKGIGTENFYLCTSHVSEEDSALAKELGVKILNKNSLLNDLREPFFIL
ncbi:MAG: hypothetical protein Q7R98_00500 [Candidatus Jorgensenbacteria bacterium]|nr:hypothetical protein [Candidatus Jorgensenbacteria bacterium]